MFMGGGLEATKVWSNAGGEIAKGGFFLKLDCFLPYNNKISKCETKFPAVQLYPRDLHHRHDHNPWQRGNVLAHFDQRKVSEAGRGRDQ